ncbi:MAG: hypothetical protein J3T61_00865 [Candidatus Brocadiales bacterium]|nr:hypothetical protein [Candidatus Bathyanammoxibius sp.]
MVQQAESTDGTATVEHQNVPTGSDGASDSVPTVDELTVRVKELEGEKATLTQRAKTSEGRNSLPLESFAKAEQVDLLTQAVERLQIELASDDGEAKTAKLAALDEKGKQAATVSEFNTRAATVRDLISARLDEATEAGIDTDDPEITAVFDGWAKKQMSFGAIETVKDVDRAYGEISRLLDKKILAFTKKEQKDAQNKSNQENNTLAIGSGTGGGGGGPTVTNDNVDALWVEHDRAHPDTKNPYDAKYREVLGR